MSARTPIAAFWMCALAASGCVERATTLDTETPPAGEPPAGERPTACTPRQNSVSLPTYINGVDEAQPFGTPAFINGRFVYPELGQGERHVVVDDTGETLLSNPGAELSDFFIMPGQSGTALVWQSIDADPPHVDMYHLDAQGTSYLTTERQPEGLRVVTPHSVGRGFAVWRQHPPPGQLGAGGTRIWWWGPDLGAMPTDLPGTRMARLHGTDRSVFHFTPDSEGQFGQLLRWRPGEGTIELATDVRWLHADGERALLQGQDEHLYVIDENNIEIWRSTTPVGFTTWAQLAGDFVYWRSETNSLLQALIGNELLLEVCPDTLRSWFVAGDRVVAACKADGQPGQIVTVSPTGDTSWPIEADARWPLVTTDGQRVAWVETNGICGEGNTSRLMVDIDPEDDRPAYVAAEIDSSDCEAEYAHAISFADDWLLFGRSVQTQIRALNEPDASLWHRVELCP
ncbi:MAG: hypothetical protein ACE366_12350 [Bradymonadia bacterium]